MRLARLAAAFGPILAPGDGAIRVLHHRAPAWVAQDPTQLFTEGRPQCRGFRVTIPKEDQDLDHFEPWPLVTPGADHATPMWKSAEIVNRRLAKDGLLWTLVEVLRTWRASESSPYAKPFEDDKVGWLKGAGLPVDLLAFFRGEARTPRDRDLLIEYVDARVRANATDEKIRADLAALTFDFQPSCPGFAVATESGENEIGSVRLQLTGGGYWTGVGDGGSVDVARQLLAALPDADFVASVEEKHLQSLLETAKSWAIGRDGRVTFVAEPFPVSQWAQDDGKPGFAPQADGGGKEVVTLLPRYPSRGEDGAAFIPGEAFATAGFASAGHRVAQSSLLFQGGNLIAVRDPKTGERSLLIGEAEIWRNTALGLTQQQVQDAFRAEFGVDRCIVLPATSFHVDFELSVRARGAPDDRLVAFVDDPAAATLVVLECGVGALEAGGILDASTAGEARAQLSAGRLDAFLSLVGPAIQQRTLEFGRFPESIARSFGRGAADSGVGNFQRFLLAMDLAMSRVLPAGAIAAQLDPHSAAYLRSFQRRDAERASVIAQLERLGFDVVRVPGLSDSDRGISYLNGLHDRSRFLMPAWGGLFEPLDRAARTAFERGLGPGVEVVPILSSESQRRGGAVRCAASALPKS